MQPLGSLDRVTQTVQAVPTNAHKAGSVSLAFEENIIPEGSLSCSGFWARKQHSQDLNLVPSSTVSSEGFRKPALVQLTAQFKAESATGTQS